MSTKKKYGGLILDRDGVLTSRHLLTWKKSQLRLSRGIAQGIKFFNDKKIPVVVITNQAVVARGWITEAGVERLHQVLNKRLKKSGAHVDKFYFCPHHPEATIASYRKICACRKPGTKQLKDAAREWRFNLKKSVFIGDMTQDILAGKRVDAKTILVMSGHGGQDRKFNVRADFEARDIVAALNLAKRLLL